VVRLRRHLRARRSWLRPAHSADGEPEYGVRCKLSRRRPWEPTTSSSLACSASVSNDLSAWEGFRESQNPASDRSLVRNSGAACSGAAKCAQNCSSYLCSAARGWTAIPTGPGALLASRSNVGDSGVKRRRFQGAGRAEAEKGECLAPASSAAAAPRRLVLYRVQPWNARPSTAREGCLALQLHRELRRRSLLWSMV